MDLVSFFCQKFLIEQGDRAKTILSEIIYRLNRENRENSRSTVNVLQKENSLPVILVGPGDFI